MPTGRVAELVAPRKVEIREFELPSPEKGAVLTRVLRSNLCGTEIHIWNWAHPILKNVVLGHEMIGEIYSLGEGVVTDYAGQPVNVGDRVVAPYYVTCRKCPPCSQGNFNLCQEAYRAWSKPPKNLPHFTGTFATHYYIQPDQYFYKVPESLPSEILAGANCALSQILFGFDKAKLASGETVVIQGAGGLGLYGVAAAKEIGAKVIIIDGIEERLELARKFGADHTINLSQGSFETVLQEVLKLTDGNGPDVVLEVAGVPQAFSDALQMVRVMGRIISIGNVSIGEDHEVKIAPGLITRKSVTVIGAVRYDPWYLLKAVKFLERTYRKIDYTLMSATDFSLDEVGEALLKAEKKEVIRATIVP